MGVWVTAKGDPWRATIFGQYSNTKGSYWNCSATSLCGNFTDNIKLKDPSWILIGEWHQLPETCSTSRDCPGGIRNGYARIGRSMTINDQVLSLNIRSPPAVENGSLWTKVPFKDNAIPDFNASKPWAIDEPMRICVFPLSGTYGKTQRIWFYLTLVLSISDFFPELLRLVSLGNVVTTSFSAAIQQLQLYHYRPSVAKIVDLDTIAGAHILAITMWATVFWILYSRIFGEKLKPAYRIIAHVWLVFIAAAFLMGTRARYWTQDQLELVESDLWYRFTSPCYVNAGGATEFWSRQDDLNSTIRTMNEAVVVTIPPTTMHDFTYMWDRTPFYVKHRIRGPPLDIWLVLPAFFTLIAGTLIPRATWPPREKDEAWVRYFWRRRKGRANLILLGLLGPATFCAWPGLLSWSAYTEFFNNTAFPPAESPARIGQWSTTIALSLAVFTAIDHFVPRRWKGETPEPEKQSYELVTGASKPSDEEALCSGALAPSESDGIVAAEDATSTEQAISSTVSSEPARRRSEAGPSTSTGQDSGINIPPRRFATQ